MRSSAFITFFHDALNAYNKMCEPILHEFDIPQVSFDILMFLNNNPELTAGYLQRGTVAGDRRKVLLSCTEKAQPILKAGLEMQQDFNQKLTLDIPQKYMNIFKEITDSMAVNARQMLNK